MKKYAADNLLFLREQYPEIYRLVSNRAADPGLYRREEARNGQANLIYQPEGQAPLTLYSRYDPGLEAGRWAASMAESLGNAGDVLVAGFGLGYHAAALLAAYPDKRFFIYEPDLELFLHAVETVDLRPILGSRQIAVFAVGKDDWILKTLVMGLFKSRKGEFAYAILPYCKRMDPELEQRVKRQISQSALGYRADLSTVARYRTEWLENFILNMERNLRTPNFYPMKDACRGIPAIIAGSGPSLGLAIDTLREAKRHALLIAAGTAAQSLLHHGIEPHLIVSMDPGEPNRRAFEKLEIGHIPFLYIPTIKHTAIRDDRSPWLMHAFFNIDIIAHYLMDLTPEDCVLASTSSVTGTCIQAAVHLGCADIVFIGQDFSFPNNQVYASGVQHVPENALQKRIQDADLTVPNVAGGVNATNRNMLVLKQDVEEVIREYSEATFYNASPVGAVIEHTEQVSLDELVKRFSDIRLNDDWLKERMKERLKPYPPARIAKVADRVSATIGQLRAFQETLRQADDLLSIGDRSRPTADWFARFEPVWAKLVGDPLYEKIFSFFLLREKLHAERYWEDMRQETNLALKYRKLLNCAGPLVNGLKKLVPETERLMGGLSEKLAHLHGVKG